MVTKAKTRVKRPAKKTAPKKPAAKVSPSEFLLKDPGFALSNLARAVAEVEERNKTAATLNVTDLSRYYISVKNAAEALGEISKALNAHMGDLKGRILPEKFEAEGLTSHNLAEGFRVGVSTTLRCSIKGEPDKITVNHLIGQNTGHIYASSVTPDFPTLTGVMEPVIPEARSYEGKDAAYWWLRLNNLGDLISETVNAGTLAAAAKARLDQGFDMPEAYFNSAFMPNTSVTKTKPAKE